MQTSQKRTKKSIDKKFLGAILGICLVMTGCSKKEKIEETIVEPEQTESVTEKVETIDYQDYSGFYDRKVQVKCDTTAYRLIDGTMVETGVFKESVYLDIASAQEGNLIQIKGTDYYVNGDDVAECDRWFRNQTHLVPFNEALVTTDSFILTDEKGTTYLESSLSDTYQIYVKPSESDDRYGVLFQNGVYYIPAEYVQDVYSMEGNDVAVANELPVLMYHFFYDESLGEKRADGNYVEVNELDSHLNYLSENDYATLTMRETLYFMEHRANIPLHSVAITIDDGDPSVYERAYPVFMKYGSNATIFLICGWEDPTMSYPNWEMRENGLELQSHGFLTHQGGCSGMGHGGRLMCMAYDEGVEDTRMSFDYCDGGFVYCYPFGDVNENGKTIIRDAGAKLAFTTAYGKINPSMDPLELPRIRVNGGNSLESWISSIN